MLQPLRDDLNWGSLQWSQQISGGSVGFCQWSGAGGCHWADPGCSWKTTL